MKWKTGDHKNIYKDDSYEIAWSPVNDAERYEVKHILNHHPDRDRQNQHTR